MTSEERKAIFMKMIEPVVKAVESDSVLGLMIVVVPSRGPSGRPLVALGGHFSLGELDSAFTEVMREMEVIVATDADQPVSVDGGGKKVLH